MRDELRRLDHLTRDQRALVTEHSNGDLRLADDGLHWIDPREPLPLDATVGAEDSVDARTIVELLEEPRDPIESFELRDAFCRAGAALPDRHKYVVVKRELEGLSNTELADEFDVTEGRASQLRASAIELMRDQIGDSFVDAA